MKKIGAALCMGVFLLGGVVFAQTSDPSSNINPGDIRIFNAGSTIHHLKFELLACQQNIDCKKKDLVPIAGDSSELNPGTYYTYRLGNTKAKLEGKRVYVKIYSFNQNIWYVAIPLIDAYSSSEDPFYQFVCWDRQGPQPPHCSQGSEGDIGGD